MEDLLSVAITVPRTEAEGPGMRYALWVQGCPFRCRGCCNPEYLSFSGPSQHKSPDDLAREVIAASVEGVSLLGGEPFAQARPLSRFARLVREAGLTVMVYTGYTLEELRSADAPDGAALLLAETDLLVDGRYEESLRTTTRRWVGSENQVMHFLTDAYRPDDPRFHEPNTVEIHIIDGKIIINGFPVLGARTRL